MDELGIEPKTSPLQGERATNYATRPLAKYKYVNTVLLNTLDF